MRENRIEFSAKVRRIVAARAGHKCSFPGCPRVTVGPGAGRTEVAKTGVAAHIFSAASGGPRGQGGLEPSEISSSENAIWFCGHHATLVDTNQGVLYPAQLLQSWKTIREARAAQEHSGISAPLGWFHQIRVNDGPLFATPFEIVLGKVSLIVGANDTGKTAIWEWLAGIGDESYLRRWRKVFPPARCLDVEVAYFDPLERNVRFHISLDEKIDYWVSGKPVPLQPLKVNFVQPKDPSRIANWKKLDDLGKLAAMLSLPETIVQKILESKLPETRLIRGWRITQKGKKRIIHVVQRDALELPMSVISHSELAYLVMDIAMAVAEITSAYSPTVLVLDSVPAHLDNTHLIEVVQMLSARSKSFQSILTIPTRKIVYDELLNAGANLFFLKGKTPNVTVTSVQE